ncbi:GTP cyclohydrolase II [Methylophilus medardicus]|uniref:GTP cyclohydrolase-2 n=1 Tax=Methylophilus medardicus TaxID=2588534 RepID=A0A5B8CSX8_9PROT|nr:GTP cyclohydrolase II [Methylophilus medardicus]QDC44424.1 GTP cyclohydrolase II [Methylophilus medardicus]QDC49431.1 GTP cyclohydrolase II [Methylophilus medardicus]QDC53136.1 GTP cyclohydrolase II [Methylophilus medardicus]
MLFLSHTSSARLPTQFGTFDIHVFSDRRNGLEHIALACGEVQRAEAPLVRVHSECLTGDIFGSTRCDCGEQLHHAQRLIQETGHGLILYLKNHEGRGIGLTNKMRAYALQDQGLDTVEANEALGLPVDARSYEAAADMLAFFDIQRIRLLSNNQDKRAALQALGISIAEQVPLLTTPTHENLKYLQTKSHKLGHLIPDL